MTEYVVLLTGDADRWFTSMTDEERAAGYAEYERFDAELARRGHVVTGGAELQGSSTARRIEAGTTVVTAGPFTEDTEQVGGFFLVQTDDLDDLPDCCTILAGVGDRVEVRPVVDPESR